MCRPRAILFIEIVFLDQACVLVLDLDLDTMHLDDTEAGQ